ncbi:MAG TPA: HEAT repeat domain-containing protein [Methylomirabilota bacterium]|nr:HEAT repeat domain-containing protein [Methylomirabilota bacterium]
MATSTSQVSQVVEGFLKELLGAKKAIKLYPAGNPQAAEWIQRLHRALEHALKEGLPHLLRIEPGRFEWEGGQFPTKDQALESFRFDLETRSITEIAIDPGVESRELQHFLDCLNLRHEDVDAAGGLPALLSQRNVVHITLRGPSWGESAGTAGPGPATAMMDLLESLIGAIVEALTEQFRELTYDRLRLSAWLLDLAHPGDRADAVFRAVQMLIPLVEAEPDREIRFRTINECLMALPEPLRSSVVTGWLMPAVRTDLHILNLLTRFSGDEFAELVGLLPANSLEALRTEIEALPVEEWKKARLAESLEDALAEKEVATAPIEALIADDDPALLALREAARVGCTPDLALVHSVNVLFHLIGETESEGYPTFLVDALEEAVTDALGRDQLGEALLILRWLGQPVELRPEWQAEHQRRLQLLHRRLAGRSQIALLTDLLSRRDDPGDVAAAAEYVRTLGREAMDEFIDILADEQEGGPRGRLLDVLGAIGPAAAPVLRARVGDGSWQLARNMIALLTRLADQSAYPAIEKVARHEHPYVRREVARALAALGGKQALTPLLEYLSDPDGEVRLTAIKLLGGLVDASTVGPLRDFLATPTRNAGDLLIKREMLTALASIGSPEARVVVEAIAQRRVWPWQRNELTVRDLAVQALKSMGQPAAARED